MPMRLIPAGISRKSGKPYNAFWSCDSRNGGCGETARAEGEAAQAAPAATPEYGGQQSANQDRLAVIEQKLDQIIGFLQQ